MPVPTFPNNETQAQLALCIMDASRLRRELKDLEKRLTVLYLTLSKELDYGKGSEGEGERDKD